MIRKRVQKKNRKANKNNQELVVLVNEADEPIATARKDKVHSWDTPLHRGISVFLFDEAGKILVQQRADHKLTWPGVWSNSCCGHPLPDETYKQAVIREVKEELGLEIENLKKAANYQYRFEREGMVENEICPIFIGKTSGEVRLDPSEVKDYKWMEWQEFVEELENDRTGKWSEWCKEEVEYIKGFLRSNDFKL